MAKMLACGNPEKLGSVAYRCLHCGQGKPLVALRWKSSWCVRGATVSVDTWGSQGRRVLPAGVISRHLILTVPAMCRTTLSHNAEGVLNACRRCGAQGLEAFSSPVRGQALKGGASTVLPTPGRHGQYHPPRHLLAPRGG